MMTTYKEGDAIELLRASGEWVAGRIESVRPLTDLVDGVAFADIALADGDRVVGYPTSCLRPKQDADVPNKRALAVMLALMPTEIAAQSAARVPNTLRCEAGAYTGKHCDAVRYARPTIMHHVRVSNGRRTEPFTLCVLADGWTIADDVDRVELCPYHSRSAHRWLNAFLEGRL